eukprot:11580295-Alexandrium_andersonii.AAC.1
MLQKGCKSGAHVRQKYCKQVATEWQSGCHCSREKAYIIYADLCARVRILGAATQHTEPGA